MAFGILSPRKNSGNRIGTIYALIDPRTGLLRYIGKTICDPKARLRGHLKDAHICPRTSWIKSLLNKGLFPILITISHHTEEDVDAEEIALIASIRAAGASLLNITDGGDGAALPQSTRNKIAARGFSEEHKKKISDARRGHAVSSETRAKIAAKLRGLKQSNATREKKRAALKGRTLRPAHCAKISASKTGKKGAPLSDSAKAKLSAFNKGKKHKPHSAESRAKMSASHLGVPLSSEHRAAIGRGVALSFFRKPAADSSNPFISQP